MRTIRNATIKREAPDRQRAAGRYRPALELHLRGTLACPVTLEAGGGDTIDVFHEDGRVYVLATNCSLPYVGLQVFDADGTEVGSAFVQEHEPAPYLCELTPINRCKRMAEYTDMEG